MTDGEHFASDISEDVGARNSQTSAKIGLPVDSPSGKLNAREALFAPMCGRHLPPEEQPMTRFRIRLFAVVSALSLWAVFFESASAQVPPVPIRMRAFAVNMTNVATGANGILEIIIDSWS